MTNENITDSMEEIDLGMSNLYMSIDDGFEQALRDRPNEVFGRHAAWNFNGLVYFNGKQFVEDVYIYHSLVSTIKCDSLSELIAIANAEYGDE